MENGFERDTDQERIERVLARIEGDDGEELLPSLMERVYEKLITTKDYQCYINLNSVKYKLIEIKASSTYDQIQITLENNLVIIFDQTNIDFFITNAIVAVYQPFFV